MAFVQSIRKSFSRKRRRDVDPPSAGDEGAATGSHNDIAEASARTQRSGDSISCVVTLLDDTTASFDMEKTSMLSDLLSDVSKLLSLQESDYFGFSYTDPEGLECWLHDYKSIAKQMPGRPPYQFTFGVKFYVADPGMLREDVTRYQFCLQLRSDLFKGKLKPPPEEVVDIAAFSLQSELGDFDESMHTEGYEKQYEFVPDQEELDIYDKIVEKHKGLDGLLPFEAELRLLNAMQRLRGYGERMIACTGDRRQDYTLQLAHTGLAILENQGDEGPKTVHSTPWASLGKMSHRRRKVTLRLEETSTQVSIHFRSKRAAKEAWKSILEQHDFFSMELPAPKPKLISSILRGSTFRYSGRTQYQIKRMEDFQIRPNLAINRANSVRRSARKAPQRSASTAGTKRTNVAITVNRSHSLSGPSKISTNGQVHLDDMMRRRLGPSLDNSVSDLQAMNEDKASMLVHLGTPAQSTSNIPNPVYTSMPGDDDDLDPDYQELRSATLRAHGPSALAAESAAANDIGSQDNSQASREASPSINRLNSASSIPPSSSPIDPTTGEPMYNEISNDLPPAPAVSIPPLVTNQSVSEPITNPYEEPNFDKDDRTPHIDDGAAKNVDIVVTLTSPKGGKTSPFDEASQGSPAVSCASSRSSAKNSADENAAGAPKADHVYSMPKPRHSRVGSSGLEGGIGSQAAAEQSASETNLLSPDVMELMADLGIMEGEKDDAQSGEESNAGDQEEPENEPDAFEADPFAQPDATQYAVSDGCVSPVTPGVLSE